MNLTRSSRTHSRHISTQNVRNELYNNRTPINFSLFKTQLIQGKNLVLFLLFYLFLSEFKVLRITKINISESIYEYALRAKNYDHYQSETDRKIVLWTFYSSLCMLTICLERVESLKKFSLLSIYLPRDLNFFWGKRVLFQENRDSFFQSPQKLGHFLNRIYYINDYLSLFVSIFKWIQSIIRAL